MRTDSRCLRLTGAMIIATLLVGCGSPRYLNTSYRTPSSPSGIAQNQERYAWFQSNEVQVTVHQPLSAVALAADGASYAIVRRYLADDALPPREAVRTEELINFFPYDYATPGSVEERFALTASVFPTPWNPDTQLMHIGLKGHNLPFEERPPANVVFLVDTSGSVEESDELPLIKRALGESLGLFRPQDRIAILSFAKAAEIVLPHTSASEIDRIERAIQSLDADGGTDGADALNAAYEQAALVFDPGAVNRIVLISDGDFSYLDRDGRHWDLTGLVRRGREAGIYLSAIGIGSGNLDAARLQELARAGDGSFAYVASPADARKVLIADLGANLFPLADDARMLVEFNPARVTEYRLIGYETRSQSARDFSDPAGNAGEIGSGHSVTVLYEITPPDSPARRLLPLRYGGEAEPAASGHDDEYALVRLRYRLPGEVGELRKELIVTTADRFDHLESVPEEMRFAAAVAAFGEKLRDEGRIGGSYGYEEIDSLAQDAVGRDPHGFRRDFLKLVAKARDVECRLARVPGSGCDPSQAGLP